MRVKIPLHPLRQLIIQKAVLPLEEAEGTDPRLRWALPEEPCRPGGRAGARQEEEGQPVHAACRDGSQMVPKLKVEDLLPEGAPQHLTRVWHLGLCRQVLEMWILSPRYSAEQKPAKAPSTVTQ